MKDEDALQEIVYMVTRHENPKGTTKLSDEEFMKGLVAFLEENVVHSAIDNNYK